jgi:ubiquinone/menaquinone biosynthesis C-methylase UbiE
MLRSIAKFVLPRSIQAAIRDRLPGRRQSSSASQEYLVIESGAKQSDMDGWQAKDVSERQIAAFAPVLKEMHAGRPRADFAAAAEAVRLTGLADPLVIEVGCGSGWNSEVLDTLLGRKIRYIGFDYSMSGLIVGKRVYPKMTFGVGDATALPLVDRCCDVLLSGTVLMHVFDYNRAISESQRVTRSWAIFHTVPVLQRRETTVLSKLAYGGKTIEIIFNEGHLRDLIAGCGMKIRHVLNSVAYDLQSVLGESTTTKTYVCEVTT